MPGAPVVVLGTRKSATHSTIRARRQIILYPTRHRIEGDGLAAAEGGPNNERHEVQDEQE